MEQYSQALRGKFIVFPFCSLYKTNRFQVAVRLFSNRSQKTSKCGKDISDTLACGSCATFLFLPHFDVICDLLLNRRTATWNLFVKYISFSFYQRERPNDAFLVETENKLEVNKI